eukprot:5604000-Alexandrium_andersonii.AAC.1
MKTLRMQTLYWYPPTPASALPVPSLVRARVAQLSCPGFHAVRCPGSCPVSCSLASCRVLPWPRPASNC